MGQMKAKYGLLAAYLLLGFIILWSGGFITYGLFHDWPYVLFAVSFFIMFKRGLKLERKHVFVISVFALVALLQSLLFQGPITSIIYPTFRFLAIAMVAVIIRPYLNHAFIYLTAFFAFFSLIFWVVDVTPAGHSFLFALASDLPQFGADALTELNIERYGFENYSLYFYTVSTKESDFIGLIARNYGPFYEPGRFTIPLCISLAIILFTGSIKKYRVPFILILIANITTFSTTGYLVMIILFAGYYLGLSKAGSIYKYAMLLLVIIGSYYLMGLSFMGDKIAIALDDTDVANTRFGAMLYHLPQIAESPWIGHGAFLGNLYNDLEMSPCGITDMMRIWGVPMFIVCVVLLYQGTRSFLTDNRIYRFVFVVALLFMAYTQTIMTDPLFYLFYFIGTRDGKQAAGTDGMRYRIRYTCT